MSGVTRIIGGSAGGRPIRTPPGAGTRPTADRVREALFSSLEATLGTLHGTTFLDVFAGSGAVGLEAASRGATWVTFVERNRTVAALIAANARTLGFVDVEVSVVPAASLGQGKPRHSFTVAFLDPPYDEPSDRVAQILSGLAVAGWLAEAAVVVVERSRRTDRWEWPPGFQAERDRRYGDTLLWYGRWDPQQEGSALIPDDPDAG